MKKFFEFYLLSLCGKIVIVETGRQEFRDVAEFILYCIAQCGMLLIFLFFFFDSLLLLLACSVVGILIMDIFFKWFIYRRVKEL